MTKTEIVTKVAEEAKISKDESLLVINSFMDNVTEAMKEKADAKAKEDAKKTLVDVKRGIDIEVKLESYLPKTTILNDVFRYEILDFIFYNKEMVRNRAAYAGEL